jgi:hypothetical protein
MNTSQRRDRSNDKIFKKVGLRQSSNDSTARRVAAPVPVPPQEPYMMEDDLMSHQRKPAEEPDVMEDELMSLQRKIMDLESKLNYPQANGGTGDYKPVAKPKEHDSLSKYKETLLGNMKNVVFSDPPMGMFSIDGQDSEIRTKGDDLVKIKVDIRGRPSE